MNKGYQEMYDKIKTEEKAKDNMKNLMIKANMGSDDKTYKTTKSKQKSKKLRIAYGCAAAILLCVIGTGTYTVKAETNYITYESDVHIGVSVNCWGKVIKAEALNEEAKGILSELKLNGENYDDAVELIISKETCMRNSQKNGQDNEQRNNQENKQACCQNEGDSDISVTVKGNNQDNCEKMQENIDKKCEGYQYKKKGND